MKKYNSSALSTNRAEVLEEAANNGVIIHEKNTNGKVRREFILTERTLENDISTVIAIETAKALSKRLESSGDESFTLDELRKIRNEILE